MKENVDEVKYLKTCINNLISMLALPAVWTGGEVGQIATAAPLEGNCCFPQIRFVKLDGFSFS